MKKILSAVMFLVLSSPCFAQVSATGVGTVFVKPDCAHVNFLINTEHKQAFVAQKMNSDRSKAFFDVLQDKKLLGKAVVEDKDVTTREFSVNPKWVYQKDNEPKFVGYTVTHHISVKVRDLTRLGFLIDQTENPGGALVQGISFNVTERSKHEDEARELGLKDAKRKAEQMVKAYGVKLGKLVSVNESVENVRNIYSMAQNPGRSSDSSTQIAPGEQAISIRINAVWETDSPVRVIGDRNKFLPK